MYREFSTLLGPACIFDRKGVSATANLANSYSNSYSRTNPLGLIIPAPGLEWGRTLEMTNEQGAVIPEGFMFALATSLPSLPVPTAIAAVFAELRSRCCWGATTRIMSDDDWVTCESCGHPQFMPVSSGDKRGFTTPSPLVKSLPRLMDVLTDPLTATVFVSEVYSELGSALQEVKDNSMKRLLEHEA